MRHSKPNMLFPDIYTVIVSMSGEMKDALKENAKKFGLRNTADMARMLIYYYGINHPEKADWKALAADTDSMNLSVRKFLRDRQKHYKSKAMERAAEKAISKPKEA